ncbi:MAG: SDR family NAD(P)-dependent oxidoreductase [Microbacterium sp.]|nr:SDR family NAD(P)-dependent oxidoreductase [Microbacterium sp.]
MPASSRAGTSSACPAICQPTASCAGTSTAWRRFQPGDVVLLGEEDRDARQDVEVLVADLSEEEGVSRVAERLRDTSDPVDLLVNNAGFGLPLQFADNDIDDEVRHLRVHVEASMRLMHAALQSMRGRGGRIINVASVAGFISRSTYSACKAWLIGFSRWANAEYARDGVTVTALCPGFTHTSFHERMGLAAGQEGVPGLLWLDAPSVVRTGLRDAARGKPVSIPSLRYKVVVAVARVLPQSLTSAVARRGRV